MIENGYDVYDDTASETEVGDFLYGLVRLAKPRLVIETGCYMGHTTKRLGEAVRDNGAGRVSSCDIDANLAYKAVLACRGLPVDITVCESFSMPLHNADLVFSDSATQQMRMDEFEPCKPGCLFVVHDTWGHGAEHNRKLADWVRSKGGLVLPYGRGIGIIRK